MCEWRKIVLRERNGNLCRRLIGAIPSATGKDVDWLLSGTVGRNYDDTTASLVFMLVVICILCWYAHTYEIIDDTAGWSVLPREQAFELIQNTPARGGSMSCKHDLLVTKPGLLEGLYCLLRLRTAFKDAYHC
jgi:hypothetical protein